MSLSEKLFFTNYVPLHELSIVMDYGCGDGSLLLALSSKTSAYLVGVEHSYQQRRAAEIKLGNLLERGGRAVVYPRSEPHSFSEASLLILSSVMHEQDDPLSSFKALRVGPKYIAFRDFAFAGGLPSDLRRELHKRFHPELWSPQALLTAYLHSKWPEDPLSEDYFRTSAFSWEQAMLADGKYRPLVLRKVLPGWLDAELRKDFPGCIPTGFTTHMEVVLERIP